MRNNLLARIDTNKLKIDEHRPMQEPLLSELRAYYRVGLTWSSNALEGNSLTESETKVVLEDGLTVGGKPLRDYEPFSEFIAERVLETQKDVLRMNLPRKQTPGSLPAGTT